MNEAMIPFFITSCAFTLFEGAIFAIVVHFCLGAWRKKIYVVVIVALLASCIIQAANFFDLPHLIKSPVVFFCLIAIVYAFYRAPLYIITFYTIAVFYLNVTASLVVGVLISGLSRNPVIALAYASLPFYIISGLCIHLLQIAGALALIHFSNAHIDNPKNYWYMLDSALLLSYFLSASIVDVIPYLQEQVSPFFILAAILAFFAVNALMVVLFVRISGFHVNERRTVMIELMAKHIQQEYRQLQETNQEFARINHDWNKLVLPPRVVPGAKLVKIW